MPCGIVGGKIILDVHRRKSLVFLMTNEALVVLHSPFGFLLVKSWLRLQFKCHQPHLPPDYRKL